MDSLLARALRLPLRTKHTSCPWQRAARALEAGNLEVALAAVAVQPPTEALEGYWRVRVLATARRMDEAEAALEEARRLPPGAAGWWAKPLLELEAARLLAFRYRFREAWAAARTLAGRRSLPAELRAQAWSQCADILAHDQHFETLEAVEPWLREREALRRGRAALARARALGRVLNAAWQWEQLRKECSLLAAAKRWRELKRRLPELDRLDRVPAFHRAFFARCHLVVAHPAALAEAEAERLLRRSLRQLPRHTPGLLLAARAARRAVEQGRRDLGWERRLLDRLMAKLHALDRHADLLDWLDRGLVEHGRPLYQRHADLWLDPSLLPARTPARLRLHHALEAAEHPCNRHVLQLAADPVLRETLGRALLRDDIQQALDDEAVPVAGLPPFPTLETLESSPVVFVRVLEGKEAWHAVRRAPAGGLESFHLPRPALDDLEVVEELARRVFAGYAPGTVVHVVADGAAEDIPWQALADGEALWGARLTLVEAPNLGWLFRGEQRTAPPPSVRWPEDSRALRQAGFEAIAEADAFFRSPVQGGVLWLAGHGVFDPRLPHHSRVEVGTRAVMDVGELFQRARGCRLVVLDTCHGGARQEEGTENDLGLAHAALLGGAELVLAYRRQVGSRGPLRRRLLGSLFQALGEGLEPAQALRHALAGLPPGPDGAPRLAGESLRVLGCLP